MLKPGHSEKKRGKKLRNALDPSPQYEFVTSVGPPSSLAKVAASKQVVRIHAMRSFLRQRDANVAGGKSKNADIPRPRESQAPVAGKFKLDTWSRKSSKNKGAAQADTVKEGATVARFDTSPSIQPDLGPFELLNIPLTPQVRRLLYHCKKSNPLS